MISVTLVFIFTPNPLKNCKTKPQTKLSVYRPSFIKGHKPELIQGI